MSDKNIDKDTKKFLDNMGNRLKLAKENGCKVLDCKTIDNNIKLRLENIKLRKDLETYKKIAEFLAEELGKEYSSCEPCNMEMIACIYDCKNINCKECIIDWARKEVEK